MLEEEEKKVRGKKKKSNIQLESVEKCTFMSQKTE
jgi:hypothetical protein